MYLSNLKIIAQQNKGSESRIAKYLIEYSGDINTLKASDIADKTFVSLSSISRLVKKLGVSDFSTLKIHLSRELDNGKYANDFDSNIYVLETLDAIKTLNSKSLTDFLKINKFENIYVVTDKLEYTNIILKNEFNIITEYTNKTNNLYIELTYNSKNGFKINNNVIHIYINQNNKYYINEIYIILMLNIIKGEQK